MSIALLEQPWFWSAALAAQVDVLELVLVEGESLGQGGGDLEAGLVGGSGGRVGGCGGSGVGCRARPRQRAKYLTWLIYPLSL